MTSRLDNFTGAAFAFAMSLLVIGGARAPAAFGQLTGALGDISAFAFGFAESLPISIGRRFDGTVRE